MEDLERKIKELYTEKALSSEQIESIQGIANRKRKKIRSSFNIVRKYAAVFLFMVVVSTSAYCLYFFSSTPHDNLLNEFATEIAYNHQKKLSSKIKTSDIDELNTKLPKLNFKIELPTRITDELQLKGGQYCSVDDRIAAQLKFENKEHKTITCYIFKKEENFNFDTDIFKNDTKVTLWDSGTLVYALAVDD